MTALEQLDRTILLCRDYTAEAVRAEEICETFQSLQILCVSDAHNLSSHSGQTALVTLVLLLSRMGMQVGLDIPDIAILGPQPPITGTSLSDALTSSSETLVTGATVHRACDFKPDIVFVLGNTELNKEMAPYWRLTGTDWFGALIGAGTARAHLWTATWPVGSMVSAALAANEAFKLAMRRLPLRDESGRVFFKQSACCRWDFDSLAMPDDIIDLGEVDLISAGAISQATLYALLRFPNVRMHGRIFDDDTAGASNLNRNMLSVISDVGLQKVVTVAQRCGSKLALQPINRRFSGKSFGDKLAGRVLVGVDDIPSRWDIQQHTPGWLAVSGTSHFNVSSSEHTLHDPCSGCLHPLDEVGPGNPIPTASFVSFWAGLAMAVRLLREAVAHPYSKERQHLWLTPLRMDLRHAAMWLPVATRRDCPVQCLASRSM